MKIETVMLDGICQSEAYRKASGSLSDAQIKILLKANSAQLEWNKDTGPGIGKTVWKRSDGEAFAFFEILDRRLLIFSTKFAKTVSAARDANSAEALKGL